MYPFVKSIELPVFLEMFKAVPLSVAVVADVDVPTDVPFKNSVYTFPFLTTATWLKLNKGMVVEAVNVAIAVVAKLIFPAVSKKIIYP